MAEFPKVKVDPEYFDQLDTRPTVAFWGVAMSLGMAGPHSLKQLKAKLKESRMTLTEIETIFKSLHSVEMFGLNEYFYNIIMCNVRLHRDGSQKRAYRYYRAALKAKDKGHIKGTNFVVQHALTLHSLGKYQKSIDLVRSTMDPVQTFKDSVQDSIDEQDRHRLLAINYFDLAEGKQCVSHCQSYAPFRMEKGELISGSPWIDNAIFGINVCVLIGLGQEAEAKQLLMRGMNNEHFIPNPIIAFCAAKFGWNYCRETLDRNYLDLAEVHVDIFCRFQAMLWDAVGDVKEAILLLHRCTFFGAHAIHYHNLAKSYKTIGLYDRAKECFKRAIVRYGSNEKSPNVQARIKDSQKKEIELGKVIKKLHCEGCGAQYSSDHHLHPCSGCLEVWYCSKRCQKIQWKKIHRRRCNKTFCGFKKRLKVANQSPFP